MEEMYTKLEVVELLVKNNNYIMEMLRENKKFVIEGEEVVCYLERYLGKRKEISRYSFDYVIEEVRRK